MTVFLDHGHTPFAFGMALALPDVQFVVHEWRTEFRYMPNNVRYGTPCAKCTHLVSSYPDRMNVVPGKPVKILVVHCEGNPESEKSIFDSVQANPEMRVVVVSGHKRTTYGHLASRWSVIPFCIPSKAYPYLWSDSSLVVGAIHNVPTEEIAGHWLSVSGGFPAMFVGHGLEPLLCGPKPKSFGQLLALVSQFAVGVNVVVGDAFGMSPQELMACGIPLVTSWCEDMPDFIFRGHTAMGARSFYSAAIPQMRDDIRFLLSNKDAARKIGNAGRDMVLAHRGETVIGKLWMDVLS